MKIEHRLEELVREALFAAVNRDDDRLDAALRAFPDNETRSAGLKLLAAICVYVLIDIHDGEQPTDIQIQQAAAFVAKMESWSEATSDDIAAYMRLVLGDTTAFLGPDDAVAVAFIVTASLLASRRRAESMTWLHYLDEIEKTIEIVTDEAHIITDDDLPDMKDQHLSSPPTTPGPVARRLFFTDFEGQPAEPEDVFIDGRDGGWVHREPDAIALLVDPTAQPYDRFLACSALTAWGSPVGYQTVIDAAADPESVVWRDHSADRRFGVDDTFALLAEDVGRSADIAEQRGNTAARRAAQAALLGLTDRYFFDRRLEQGMYAADVRALATELDAAVAAGMARLHQSTSVGFDLATQIAGLIRVLARVDQPSAKAFAAALVAAEPNDRAIRELGELAL